MCLHFIIYKVGIVTAPISKAVVRFIWVNTGKALRITTARKAASIFIDVNNATTFAGSRSGGVSQAFARLCLESPRNELYVADIGTVSS